MTDNESNNIDVAPASAGAAPKAAPEAAPASAGATPAPKAAPEAPFHAEAPTRIYNRVIKRALDAVIAFMFMLCFCWLYAIIAVAVKLDSPGPVIFKQERIGRDGRTFNMYKFRTMRDKSEREGSGVYSNDEDDRLTRVGRILRKTSLDELPQLVNMLKGDMSLIGPRPPLTYHPWPLEQYTERQRHMFDVRPGLTGWAQINGRRTVEWGQRIEYNLHYVANVSLALDAEIFFKTFAKLLNKRENQNTEPTVSA